MVEIRGKNENDSLFLIKDENVKTVDDALRMSRESVSKQP